MALTAKQQRFVEEYLVDLNATQAAIRAGYSEKNADKIGSELLGKTGVAEAVQEAMAKRSAKTGLTAEKVLADLEELRKMALSDKHYSTAAKCIELQGKHLKIFTDKHELSGQGGGPVEHNMTVSFVSAKRRDS